MEALAKIDALVPDIVIMDINIPIMNGLKVIELARMKHPDMAFVVVSGYDDFSYCREALRLKITDYILKPVNYEEFGACIDNLKIARFQKTVTEAPTEQGERTITGLTRYLQAHLAEDISLGMLSDEFHLSAQYISQLFKSEIGVMFILDVAALPPRRRAVRNGARVISGSAISTGSRPKGRLLFIFLVLLEKQRMFSPVLGILEAERGRSL